MALHQTDAGAAQRSALGLPVAVTPAASVGRHASCRASPVLKLDTAVADGFESLPITRRRKACAKCGRTRSQPLCCLVSAGHQRRLRQHVPDQGGCRRFQVRTVCLFARLTVCLPRHALACLARSMVRAYALCNDVPARHICLPLQMSAAGASCFRDIVLYCP